MPQAADSKDSVKLVEDFEKLEKIVASFESGDIDLDSGISKFEEGLKIADNLKKSLEKLENKIVKVKEKF